MRTDIDVLFVGGPLGELAAPIEKSANPVTGSLEAPQRIPVGHLPAMDLGDMIVVDASEVLSGGKIMVGMPPEIGAYIPAGISDNGRRVYWWIDA